MLTTVVPRLHFALIDRGHSSTRALPQALMPLVWLAQFLTEIALPMLFAAIDALMCLLDYFKPSGGTTSSSASRTRASRGPTPPPTCSPSSRCPSSSAASRPSWTRRSTRARASASSRRPSRAPFSSKGRTKDPVSGRTVDNNEPESASMGNPIVRVRLCGRVGRLHRHDCRRRVRQVLRRARCPSCASSGGLSPRSARSSRRPTLRSTRAT